MEEEDILCPTVMENMPIRMENFTQVVELPTNHNETNCR
jgi:hypothetical protein